MDPFIGSTVLQNCWIWQANAQDSLFLLLILASFDCNLRLEDFPALLAVDKLKCDSNPTTKHLLPYQGKVGTAAK